MAAIEIRVPMRSFSSALAFFDGYRCDRLPANMLQAMRDYFGAHVALLEDFNHQIHSKNTKKYK